MIWCDDVRWRCEKLEEGGGGWARLKLFWGELGSACWMIVFCGGTTGN